MANVLRNFIGWNVFGPRKLVMVDQMLCFTARQQSCRKVMLSLVSVCSHGVVPPYNPPPHDMFKLFQIGPHCTGTPPPNIFKLVQVILNCKGTLSPPHPQKQTCSELFIVKLGLSARGQLEVIGQLDPFKMLRSYDEPKVNFEIILSKISTSLTRYLA